MPSPDNFIEKRASNDADTPDFSPEVFNIKDVPSPDNFVQIFYKNKHLPHDDAGDQYKSR